jgi:ribosome modulation factor
MLVHRSFDQIRQKTLMRFQTPNQREIWNITAENGSLKYRAEWGCGWRENHSNRSKFGGSGHRKYGNTAARGKKVAVIPRGWVKSQR